tara:strand:+ start:928 stop:1059 length:132 start_codon:yes stop_codon:yes gene_type:complete
LIHIFFSKIGIRLLSAIDSYDLIELKKKASISGGFFILVIELD